MSPARLAVAAVLVAGATLLPAAPSAAVTSLIPGQDCTADVGIGTPQGGPAGGDVVRERDVMPSADVRRADAGRVPQPGRDGKQRIAGFVLDVDAQCRVPTRRGW